MKNFTTSLLAIFAILSLGACSSTGGFRGATNWMGITSHEDDVAEAESSVEVTKEHLDYVSSVAEYFNVTLASAESGEKRDPREAREMDVQLAKLNVQKAKADPKSELGVLYSTYESMLRTEKTNAAQGVYTHPPLEDLNQAVELAKNVQREAKRAHTTAEATYAKLTGTDATKEASQNQKKAGETAENLGRSAAQFAGIKVPTIGR